MHTAQTSEVDDLTEALKEIKEQIDFGSLKRHSAGIIFCHMDFVESGMVAELCEQLPFEVIGMSSMASADNHGYSLFDLTLTVLTSDEVSFFAGMTESVQSANYREEIEQLFTQIQDRAHAEPAMIFSFMPYTRDVPGHEFVIAMDKICKGTPIWGSITTSSDFNYETVHTICNGKTLRSGLAMMFVCGPVQPQFIVTSIPERNIASNRAIVTDSCGAVIRQINDMPILEYLASLGLVITKENITTTPLMLYPDGAESPIAMGFYTLFEDGSVLAGCEIPVGTSVAVGSIDAEGIFESASSGLQHILQCKNREATLLLPCVTRYLMQAPDQERELRLIQEELSQSGKPFVMGYSGGEICPVMGTDGKYHNIFHNYAFCACIL